MPSKMSKKINKLITLNRFRGQRGIAIYLAVVALAVVLTLALGLSLFSAYQLKSLNEAGNSVKAFAAAESGIEWALGNVNSANYASLCPKSGVLGNGATYGVTASLCGADNKFLCVKSIGDYIGTQRAIRIMK